MLLPNWKAIVRRAWSRGNTSPASRPAGITLRLRYSVFRPSRFWRYCWRNSLALDESASSAKYRAKWCQIARALTIICSERLYNIFCNNGWLQRFAEVPSPADLEKVLL